MHLACAASAGVFFKRANVQYLLSSPLSLIAKEDTCGAKIDGHKAKGPPGSAYIPPPESACIVSPAGNLSGIYYSDPIKCLLLFSSLCVGVI